MHLITIFTILVILDQFSSAQRILISNQNAQLSSLEPQKPVSFDLENDTKFQVVRENFIRCGYVQTQANGATISYKPWTQVVDNERCVWIVAAPKATGYIIDLQYLGLPTNRPDSGQEFTITGITYSAGDVQPKFTTVRPTSSGKFNISDAHVLLVTFVSSTVKQDSYGFYFVYETIFGTGQVTSTQSTHHLFDSTTIGFKYPISERYYDKNELATFVFLPHNNIKAERVNQVTYKGLERLCPDYVWFYTYNSTASSSEERWSGYHGRCVADALKVLNDDMILAVFLSGDNSSGPGFWLNYGTSLC